jgi:hypothetical protein
MTDAAEAIAAIRESTEAVKAVREEVAGLRRDVAKDRKYSRRSRKFIVLDVVLTVAVTVFGYLALHNQATISALHSSTVSVCEQSNSRLAKDHAIWAYVLGALKPPPGASAVQRDRADMFDARLSGLVGSAYQLRDCKAIYKP